MSSLPSFPHRYESANGDVVSVVSADKYSVEIIVNGTETVVLDKVTIGNLVHGLGRLYGDMY